MAVLCLFLAFGCKKDKNDSLKDQIVGRWKIESTKSLIYANGELVQEESDDNFDDNDYIEFKSDGTISSSDDSENGSRFTVDEKARTITITESSNQSIPFTIVQLDKSVFHISAENTQTQEGQTLRYVAELRFKK